jgi:hypothetical protein
MLAETARIGNLKYLLFALAGASQVLSIERDEGVRSPSPLNGERFLRIVIRALNR